MARGANIGSTRSSSYYGEFVGFSTSKNNRDFSLVICLSTIYCWGMQDNNKKEQPVLWDDEPTVEIPVQTMRELVFGDRVGHEAIGPTRPTRNMKPVRR